MNATTTRRAVIDVGTNSVKLLVVEIADGELRPLFEESKQTRLGAGFYQTNILQADAIERTAAAAKAFADRAGELGAQRVRIIATSAAREAQNGRDLVLALEASTGLRTEIISGEQEAQWVYQGVSSNPALANQRLLIMDLGGGSTEFILGAGDQPQFCRSFPLGCVRLIEELQPAEKPSAAELAQCRARIRQFLAAHVEPVLGPVLPAARPLLAGTGGTATFLARMEKQMDDYDRAKIESARFTLADLTRWTNHLWSLSLAERQRVPGLPPNRADVILMGAAVYEAVLERFALPELRISTRGVRFGAVATP